jgi:hypothetical protein
MVLIEIVFGVGAAVFLYGVYMLGYIIGRNKGRNEK